MRNLSPADATDECLWATLCLDHYKEYVRDRWTGPGKSMERHIFASGIRDRQRDNGIGRLWWSAYFLKQIEEFDKDFDTEYYLENIIFKQQDLRAQLIDRNTTSANKKLFKTIMKTVDQQSKQGIQFNREKTRDFIKELNFLEYRRTFLSFDQDQLNKIVRECFLDHYK